MFAVVATVLWIAALAAGLSAAPTAWSWHGNEMLFGFGAAALAGFLTTAIPNWTGQMPLSGPALASLWLAGRVAMLAIPWIGVGTAVEALFLPALVAVCARELAVGRKWKDMKILAAIVVIGIATSASTPRLAPDRSSPDGPIELASISLSVPGQERR